MERVKRIILIISIIFISATSVFADAVSNVPVQVRGVNDCTRTFPIGYEKLYYLTLSALNKNNYKIEEIQSRSGYILFSQNRREFLATIIYVSSAKSMLKITPFDCKYNFYIDLPNSIFNYIETYQGNSY